LQGKTSLEAKIFDNIMPILLLIWWSNQAKYFLKKRRRPWHQSFSGLIRIETSSSRWEVEPSAMPFKLVLLEKEGVVWELRLIS